MPDEEVSPKSNGSTHTLSSSQSFQLLTKEDALFEKATMCAEVLALYIKTEVDCDIYSCLLRHACT
jgi:hypothetical protein